MKVLSSKDMRTMNLCDTCIWYTIMSHVFTGDTPCPLFENDKIIQQPADFLTLSQQYSTAATSYIHQMAGMFVYCTY